MGGSLSKSKSSKDAGSVWGGQAPFLQNLYQQAQGAAGDQSAQNFAGGLAGQGQGAYNFLTNGGAQFDPNGANQQGLQQLAGGGNVNLPGLDSSQLNNFGSQQNTALNGAIDAGLGQISNNFNRNIMPGINSGSVASGTSGGSRQGIAQALAANDANQRSSDFVNQMQSNNFSGMQQRNLGAAQSQMQAQIANQGNQLQGQLGGMQNQLGAYQQLGNQGYQQAQLTNQAMLGGLGQGGALANMGFQSQFGNLNMLAQLLGSPTVLGGGGNSSSYGASGGLFGG